MPNLPTVGDEFVGISLVWTVIEVHPSCTISLATGELQAKVVLAHPLGGELHLPGDDFATMVELGTLEPFGVTASA